MPLFGIHHQKPRHYREMTRIVWENRDQLPFAWRILRGGACDGCALGTWGRAGVRALGLAPAGGAPLHGAPRAVATEHGTGPGSKAAHRRGLAPIAVVRRNARPGRAAGGDDPAPR